MWCIGNDQSILKADLSKLKAGFIPTEPPVCHTRDTATNYICGKKGKKGIFSADACSETRPECPQPDSCGV